MKKAKEYVTRTDDGVAFSAYIFGCHIGTTMSAASRDSQYYFPALQKVARALSAREAAMWEHSRQIVMRHSRHVELSPGVGDDKQRYALACLDDVLNDLTIECALAAAALREERTEPCPVCAPIFDAEKIESAVAVAVGPASARQFRHVIEKYKADLTSAQEAIRLLAKTTGDVCHSADVWGYPVVKAALTETP